MIVFEWFHDKNTIIETELRQLENYKVFLLQLTVIFGAYSYTLYIM